MLIEAVQQTTFSPIFDYTKVHHIPSVTQEFIDFLKGSIEMQIHVTQHVDTPSVRSSLVILSNIVMIGLNISFSFNNRIRLVREIKLSLKVFKLENLKDINFLNYKNQKQKQKFVVNN